MARLDARLRRLERAAISLARMTPPRPRWTGEEVERAAEEFALEFERNPRSLTSEEEAIYAAAQEFRLRRELVEDLARARTADG